MKIPEKMTQVLEKDGVVAITTLGQDGPHMVNTWNSYVRVTEDGRLLVPAGYMQTTEANSEHFVGGGTGLMVWVGAAVPTGEMRC